MKAIMPAYPIDLCDTRRISRPNFCTYSKMVSSVGWVRNGQ